MSNLNTTHGKKTSFLTPVLVIKHS